MIPKMTFNLGNIDNITKVSYPEVLPVKAGGVVIGEARIRKEDNGDLIGDVEIVFPYRPGQSQEDFYKNYFGLGAAGVMDNDTGEFKMVSCSMIMKYEPDKCK